MSPERAGTPPEEPATTPKMSVPASPVAGTPLHEAQSPMSILYAVAQCHATRTSDDDLTNLAWLHERDLLKGMNLVNPSPSNSVNSTPIKYMNNNHILSDNSPTSDYVDDSSVSTAESSNSSLNSPVPSQSSHRNKHPHNIPYDPLIHVNKDSKQKALPVKEIYAWILDHFPYFRSAPTGWKNSVRHNLSLNKCFQKVEKAPNLGKGSLWTVDQQYKPNLLQALTRSPFHPCSTLDPSVYFNKTKSHQEKTNVNTNRLPNPELFPYLAREMNNMVKSEISDDSLDAVDAAAVMLSLRHGASRPKQKKNMNMWQVITTSPSQDHTYSAAENNFVDEAFESDEERVPKSSTCRKIDFEDEEERRIKEGAETLLNLAGITTRKRYNSQSREDDSSKSMRLADSYDKPLHFRPRLLRKKKDIKKLANNNNNNTDDAWVKHRRELEINQGR
ncbi:Forkhead domain [Popillia japonica]|uniref:Forkhead domain n=1 Tax=Popillia japonica TaxID=7064 RepID=A0AAW1KIZ3_POPJA